MSAVGHSVAPLIVFPRKNTKQELLDGVPNGSFASGWIQVDSFLQWFQQQFLKHVKSTKDLVILVLDGHYSHTRNLELLEIARYTGVHILSLLPHCTDTLQPLDRSFMFPLKTYYCQSVETWLKQNPGRVVTHYQVAYNKAATVSVSTNGFRASGLYPCNRNIFETHEECSESRNYKTFVCDFCLD